MNTTQHPRYNEAYSIAMVCHEAHNAWCTVNADDSQKSWSDAEEWQRQSAIAGVLFRMDNPNAGHDAQHNSWMKEKVESGWKYGAVKDAEAKIHPCIVPFEELPAFQQKKDALFCAVVDAFIEKSNTLLTFGQATAAAKKGAMVARTGWNGQGMYAYIVPANSYPAVTEVAKKEFGEMVPYRAYWALKTAQNDVATWSPSGSDSLAEDWVIVNK